MHVDLAAIGRIHLYIAVVVRRDADEDAGVRTAQSMWRDPGVLARFPRQLEQQAMLGVDVRRFARGDAEELRVEQIDPFEKTATACVGMPRRLGIGIESLEEGDPARGWLGDRIETLLEQAPELVRAVRTAWESATYAHDRDVSVVHARRRRPFHRTLHHPCCQLSAPSQASRRRFVY